MLDYQGYHCPRTNRHQVLVPSVILIITILRVLSELVVLMPVSVALVVQLVIVVDFAHENPRLVET